TAQQIDAIEHEPPWNARLSAAEVAFRFAQTKGACIASESQRVTEPRGDSLEHGQVEIDGVPTCEHVGVEGAYALAEGIERGPLVATCCRALRHGAAASVHDEHFVDFWRVE